MKFLKTNENKKSDKPCPSIGERDISLFICLLLSTNILISVDDTCTKLRLEQEGFPVTA